MKLKGLCSALLALTLTGCLSHPTDSNPARNYELNTAYGYQLLDSELQPIDIQTLTASTQAADVIFIGEYHRNQASHLLEMQLFASRHQSNRQRPTILSLEMFTREQQAILERYLNSEIGEKYLMEEAPAWGNYQSSYRPLVEYAKRHQLPVVAANASGDIVRCIGRKGEDYINVLSAEDRKHIAQDPFAEIPGYQEKFLGLMGGAKHMPDNRAHNSYLAQATRDNTMAESIAEALNKNPGSQVVHLNGSFHSEDQLGTVAALKRLNPKLKIQVVTPIHLNEFEPGDFEGRDDFYYLLNPQPKEFVDPEYMKESRRAMFEKSRDKAKACKPI